MVRKRFGRRLAEEHPLEADIVTGVPDSSLSAASGAAEQLGLPYEMGFIKNRYIGRTFIEPSREIRALGVQLKLNPVRQIVEGKRVVMVDDSLVRGTTSMRIVDSAAWPAPGSSCPDKLPAHYCFLLLRYCHCLRELIAARMSKEEITRAIRADSLGYLSEEGMLKRLDPPKDSFCNSLFYRPVSRSLAERGEKG